jgi:hypothetical protein
LLWALACPSAGKREIPCTKKKGRLVCYRIEGIGERRDKTYLPCGCRGRLERRGDALLPTIAFY